MTGPARSGEMVVRRYESLGGRATATLRAGVPLVRVEMVDLLERPLPARRGRTAPDWTIRKRSGSTSVRSRS